MNKLHGLLYGLSHDGCILWLLPVQAILVLYFKSKVNVWVAVTEPRNILCVEKISMRVGKQNKTQPSNIPTLFFEQPLMFITKLEFTDSTKNSNTHCAYCIYRNKPFC